MGGAVGQALPVPPVLRPAPSEAQLQPVPSQSLISRQQTAPWGLHPTRRCATQASAPAPAPKTLPSPRALLPGQGQDGGGQGKEKAAQEFLQPQEDASRDPGRSESWLSLRRWWGGGGGGGRGRSAEGRTRQRRPVRPRLSNAGWDIFVQPPAASDTCLSVPTKHLLHLPGPPTASA